jgi:DNA-directed RNA polymerase specialized sigma subunit
MNAKEYLGRAYRLEARINNKTEQIQRLRALSEKVTASYGSEAVSHSRNVDNLTDTLARIEELETMLGDAVNELIEVRKEIAETIDLVPDTDCRMLLELRYLCMKPWYEIIGLMEMSGGHVYRMHNKALSRVDELLRAKGKEAS